MSVCNKALFPTKNNNNSNNNNNNNNNNNKVFSILAAFVSRYLSQGNVGTFLENLGAVGLLKKDFHGPDTSPTIQQHWGRQE